MRSRYLIRFDDICPTMDWQKWEPVEKQLIEHGIKPVLGVVPDNHDPELRVAPADAGFWQRVRRWRDLGWGIAMHGYQHCYVSSSAGIMGRNHYSEFAGLPEHVQRTKLERSLEIFQREGIWPDAFIAPGHSFDDISVRLLVDLGINCISDGYSLFPYVSREGMLWIPQQLGWFHKLPFGIWTVCLHVNPWKPWQVERFPRDLAAFRDAAISLDEIRRDYRNRPRTFSDQLFFGCYRTIRSIKA